MKRSGYFLLLPVLKGSCQSVRDKTATEEGAAVGESPLSVADEILSMYQMAFPVHCIRCCGSTKETGNNT
ncbi:hypothetical protein ACFS7Z_12965 [Pontibacter toksunensis]|uniref:Uncharacterized protein n=1 Tax=Pontibacter toksunensis TaxID=1332631 RepID=A0ABW6BY21_9BACT